VQQFGFVAQVSEIAPGSLKQVEIDGTELAIAACPAVNTPGLSVARVTR